MTARELYRRAAARLGEAGIDSPGPDALALTGFFLGLDRAGLALHGDETPAPEQAAAFDRAVEERAARRPLQYIFGRWDFLGLSLAVGEGVLCPREDTGILVEALAQALRNVPSPKGLDLCAGSGAVALGLCSLLPEAEAVCVELSPQAFPFLEKNLAAYPQYRIRAMQADVLLASSASGFSPASLDFIAANPPYVRTGEIPFLQPEVQKEPAMALDGGPDGLAFYRALARLWIPLLKPGGLLAVEIGEDQGAAVSALFSAHGLETPEICRDWSGLDRVVLGRRKKSCAKR